MISAVPFLSSFLEGFQHMGIYKNCFRMIESANEVFSLWSVHSIFLRVRHPPSKKSGGHGNEGNTPAICRCQKPARSVTVPPPRAMTAPSRDILLRAFCLPDSFVFLVLCSSPSGKEKSVISNPFSVIFYQLRPNSFSIRSSVINANLWAIFDN